MSMTQDIDSTPPFKKVLVALRENEAVDYTAEALVIRRALSLAEKFDAHLHFCDVVPKPTPLSAPFVIGGKSSDPWSRSLEHAEAKMKRLVDQVRSTGLENVDGSIVVDKPRAAGMIEQAQAVEADLILKQSRDEKFVLGILSNTDWELLRDAHVPVWLTSSDKSPADGVIAAVECRLEGEERHLRLDRRVFAAGKTLSEHFSSALYLVHAYQVHGLEKYYPIYPDGAIGEGAMAQIQNEIEAETQRVGRLHGEAIQSFVDETGVLLDDITVAEGDTATVIKREAEACDAGLIVMGADDGVNRWDRLLQAVHAEPTLDDAPCDILFIH